MLYNIFSEQHSKNALLKRVLIIILMASAQSVAFAAPVTLPVNVTEGGATWQTITATANGFFITDATFGGRTDAYDDFFTLVVNGATYAPGTSVDQSPVLVNSLLLGTAITAPLLPLGGVAVQQQFLFYHNPVNGLATVRVLVNLTNTSANDVDAVVSLGGNLGSDSNTIVQATSDGTINIGPATRWSITSDANPTTGDPINTIVYGGPGTTGNALSNVSRIASDGLAWDYDVSVPVGQTVHLMMFAQLGTSVLASTGAAQAFSSTQLFNALGLLGDLSQAQVAQILNWPTLGTRGTISGRVWFDQNGNGVQDPGEAGINGVGLQLFTTTSTSAADSAASDANGNYVFSSLVPGSYFVKIVVPTGFALQLSPMGVGSATQNSDFDPATGKTAALAVNGNTFANEDAGLFIPTLLKNSDLLQKIVDLQRLLKPLSPKRRTTLTALKKGIKDLSLTVQTDAASVKVQSGQDLSALTQAAVSALTSATKVTAKSFNKNKKNAQNALNALAAALAT